MKDHGGRRLEKRGTDLRGPADTEEVNEMLCKEG